LARFVVFLTQQGARCKGAGNSLAPEGTGRISSMPKTKRRIRSAAQFWHKRSSSAVGIPPVMILRWMLLNDVPHSIVSSDEVSD
jgi:hypothetical protein